MKLSATVNLIDSENLVFVTLGNKVLHVVFEGLACRLQVENNLARDDILIVERNLEKN